MKEKILTIVIPTYNMEEYLDRCLSSLIIEDDNLMQQLEVLIINDGSKDRSSEIAHNYEKKYPMTFSVIDKDNGNYGSCINCGLGIATGKYIKVLDADDYFDTNEFIEYLNDICLINVDMILTDFSYDQNNIDSPKVVFHQFKDKSNYYIDQEGGKIPLLMMHSVTYKTSILKENHYSQTEGISYTDHEWTFSPIFYVQNFIYLKHNVYQYVIGREGQTIDPHTIIKKVDDLYTITEKMIKQYSVFSSNVSKERDTMLKHHIKLMLKFLYTIYLQEQDSSTFKGNKISNIDNLLKEKVPDLYNETNDWSFRNYLPIKYVKYWRTNNKRIELNKIIKFIRFFKNIINK